MSWLHFLLEANIYLAVFYALYFLLLNKETYYKLNRAYLLCTPVLSYVIPLIQIGWLKSYKEGRQVVATVIYNPNLHQNPEAAAIHFTLQNILIYGYIAGVAVMLAVFAFKISQLIKLTRTQKSLLNNKYKLVKVEDTNTAFSFFNYLFIGTNVSGADTMIRHELVHIQQKHSLDIVFFELVKIINWFSPFIYLQQRSLKMVHEYIADEHTAAYENDVLTYSSFLVSNAYGLSGSSISNSFFNYNLLKKRIIMLNQKRSGNLARLKYLLTIPVCTGLLCVSTLGFSKTYGWVYFAPVQTDSTKNIPPPPPPPPVAANNKPVTFPKPKHPSQVTSKGYKYAESGYLVNGKTNYGVIIVEKNGEQKEFYKNSASAAEIKLLKDEYGYSFPNVPIYARMPPPPPAPASASQSSESKIPPPPPPAMRPLKPFEALSKYVAKSTRYPTLAFKNNLMGSVIVQFTVTNDHKVADISILKGIGSGCDEEVKRAVSAFPGTVNADPGSYKLAVTYYLKGLEPPKTASTDLFKNDPSFAGEIVVVGYPSK